MRRNTRLAILLIMVLMVGLLWSGAKKPAEKSDEVMERGSEEVVSPVGVEVQSTPEIGVEIEAEEGALNSNVPSEQTGTSADPLAEDGGSAHISPGLDSAMTYTIIPLVLLIFALVYKKQYDKEGFQRALVQLWGVIKDIDNVFSAPGADVKYSKIIESDGINGAKKLLAKATAQQTLPRKSVNILTKVAGSLDSAIELAITTFKAGSVIIPAIKKLFK